MSMTGLTRIEQKISTRLRQPVAIKSARYTSTRAMASAT